MKYAIMILFLSAGISTAADDEASKKLLKDLEGSYKIVAAEIAGQPAPAAFLDNKISIKGDKLSFTGLVIPKGGAAKSTTIVSTITVDAAKKPAHFDQKQDEGPNKEKSALGIVVIDGDTIKICSGRAGVATRPTEFKTSKELPFSLLTLKKVKE
jgi:uncharacterized protein (TIGR03067 family)